VNAAAPRARSSLRCWLMFLAAGALVACGGPAPPDRARADAAFARGAELHGGGYGRDAERAYREALAADPTNAGVLNALGVLSAQWGRLGAAEAHYRRAIRVDPNFARAYYELALLRLKTRDYVAAIGLLEQAARLAPTDADVSAALTAAYGAVGRARDGFGPQEGQ